MKQIEVNISQCLSSIQTIEVPDDYVYDPTTLEDYVEEQIILPSDVLNEYGYNKWIIDDFCVL